MFLQKSRKEDGGQSGGEEEPEEENHTPLPPPMQIIKDPNNPEVQREELWYVIGKLLLINTPRLLDLKKHRMRIERYFKIVKLNKISQDTKLNS